MATMGALAATATIGGVLAVPGAAQAAPPPGRIVIGDSVAGMNPAVLKKHGFRVNFTVSRQFSDAPRVMRGLGSRLPRNVVIHLGTNGNVSLSTCRQVVRLAGAQRRVFLVTVRVPRSWEGPNNRVLRACDRSFTASRVHVVDWHKLSDRQPAWFYSDGYHPRESTGAVRYARLIDRMVDRQGR